MPKKRARTGADVPERPPMLAVSQNLRSRDAFNLFAGFTGGSRLTVEA
jgi:hypothetical protein